LPTRLETNFARPKNKDEFEQLLCDLCRLEWRDPNTDLRGRSGQKQLGVDVYGQPEGSMGLYRGVQCKLRSQDTQLRKAEIEKEVNEAKSFPHQLDMLIIATDAPRDTSTQDIVNAINEREPQSGGFKVGIWFWEEITQRIAAYPSVIVKHYSDYYANLTSLPLVEKLTGVPLQLLSINFPETNQQTPIEELLILRGIRIHKSDDLRGGWIKEDLLDGILFTYDPLRSDKMLLFSSQISSYVSRGFPVYSVVPVDLMENFTAALRDVGVDPYSIRVFITVTSLTSIASDIFENVFRHGYNRRGCLPTIDLAIRCTPTIQNDSLLDVNWESQLSIHRFPSVANYQNILRPALDDVLRLVAQQGNKTRVQIRPILPLPAAFAWGYSFNLRISRLGVWAREVGSSDFGQQFWLSDGEPSKPSIPMNWITPITSSPKTAVIELTTGPDIHSSVSEFVNGAHINYDVWFQLGTGLSGDKGRNIDEGFAVGYAIEVGKIFRELNQAGITDTHIFLRMPSALAVLIGQRTQACGKLYLYWFNNPTYQFAFSLQ
jgi:hypothetical protein